MLLDKTGKAREALQTGPAAGLSLADRRILILVGPAADRATSNASYGERATRRFTEILPLEGVARMEAMRAERSVAPPSLSIVARGVSR